MAFLIKYHEALTTVIPWEGNYSISASALDH
jgi:hypothetical protein